MTTFETNALEINDLNKNYPGFSLNHLNLTLPSGCILGLIGENGAGKTTTIKLILDIIKKDSGSIRILGRDCTSATTILKEEIGVVLDEVGFQECLTPLQIGHIMKDIFHNWDPSLYDQYLQKFNLPNKKEFGKFSKVIIPGLSEPPVRTLRAIYSGNSEPPYWALLHIFPLYCKDTPLV